MIYPSGDTIEERVRSRYSLVVLAAKRAKQIKEGAPVLIDTLSTNPLTIALEEIAAGKVMVSAAEETAAPVISTADSEQGDEFSGIERAVDALPLAEPHREPFLTADDADTDADDETDSANKTAEGEALTE